MKTVMRRILSLALVVVVGWLLAPAPALAQQKLKVAYLRSTPMIPQLYAEKMGYFKREGLETEILTLNNGPAVVSAVVSGSADIGFAAAVQMIVAAAQHEPIRIFTALNYEEAPAPIWTWLVASQRSGVTAVAGLAGKTIAINASGGACALLVDEHLASAGLSEQSVKILTMPFPQMQAALELGNADAACIVEPFVTSMKRSDKVRAKVLAGGILSDMAKRGRVTLDGYFARPDWLAKNAKAAAGFMRAILAANRDLAKDVPLYRKLIAEEFKMPPAVVASIPPALNTDSLVAKAAEYQPLIDALVRAKILATPVVASTIVQTITP